MLSIGSLFSCCSCSSIPPEENTFPIQAIARKVEGAAAASIAELPQAAGAEPLYLGKGVTGIVRATVNPLTNSPQAVKTTLGKDRIAILKREFTMLDGLLKGAVNTIGVRRLSLEEEEARLYMQRLPCPDLATLVCHDKEDAERLTCYELFDIAKKALEALSDYKKRKIIHTDIKPDNSCYDRSTRQFWFFDFANAIKVNLKERLTGGSLPYFSPERLYSKECDYGIDMWALGATLFEIYTSHYLFFDPAASPLTRTEALYLIGKQFKEPLFEYVGRSQLQQREDLSKAQIKQLQPEALQELGKNYLDSRLSINIITVEKAYLAPWQERIHYAARKKGEEMHAEQIIELLTAMLTIDPKARITPKKGLALLDSFYK